MHIAYREYAHTGHLQITTTLRFVKIQNTAYSAQSRTILGIAWKAGLLVIYVYNPYTVYSQASTRLNSLQFGKKAASSIKQKWSKHLFSKLEWI